MREVGVPPAGAGADPLRVESAMLGDEAAQLQLADRAVDVEDDGAVGSAGANRRVRVRRGRPPPGDRLRVVGRVVKAVRNQPPDRVVPDAIAVVLAAGALA